MLPRIGQERYRVWDTRADSGDHNTPVGGQALLGTVRTVTSSHVVQPWRLLMEQHMNHTKTKNDNEAEVYADRALLDEFEARICENLRSIVRSELEVALARERTAAIEPVGHVPKGRKIHGNLVNRQEMGKARNALRDPFMFSETTERHGLISATALARMLDTSERTLRRFMARGVLPTPIKLGRRSLRWVLEEVLAWVFHGCPPNDQWRTIKTKAMGEYRAAIMGDAS